MQCECPLGPRSVPPGRLLVIVLPSHGPVYGPSVTAQPGLIEIMIMMGPGPGDAGGPAPKSCRFRAGTGTAAEAANLSGGAAELRQFKFGLGPAWPGPGSAGESVLEPGPGRLSDSMTRDSDGGRESITGMVLAEPPGPARLVT